MSQQPKRLRTLHGIDATVIEHTVCAGAELITFVIQLPKFCDAEFEKHRMISSNSSSDRAVSFNKMVDREYFVPNDLRLEQKGMQGYTKANDVLISEFAWDMSELRAHTISVLELYPEVHKQHKNRYLLPWSYQTKVATMNVKWFRYFIGLRAAEGADPVMQELAKRMEEAYVWSQPKVITPNDWHLAFVTQEERDSYDLQDLLDISVARCARVSYNNHDGSEFSLLKDKALANTLYKENHRTPFEHQAKPMNNKIVTEGTVTWEDGVTHIDKFGNKYSGNFQGYIQYRQII